MYDGRVFGLIERYMISCSPFMSDDRSVVRIMFVLHERQELLSERLNITGVGKH